MAAAAGGGGGSGAARTVLDVAEVVDSGKRDDVAIKAMSRSPDGSKLIVGGQHLLRLVSLEDGRSLAHARNVRSKQHKSRHHDVVGLEWNPRKDLVASVSNNASVVLWHLSRLSGGSGSGGKLAEVLSKEQGGHKRAVHGLSWHPRQEDVLLTCSQDATVKLWDLRASRSVRTTFTGRHAVRAVQFHPGEYENAFVVGLESGRAEVWDLRKVKEHRGRSNWSYDSDLELQRGAKGFVSMQAHDYVLSVAWHPTQKEQFASSGRDGLVHCWDLGKNIKQPAKVRSRALVPSGLGRYRALCMRAGDQERGLRLLDLLRRVAARLRLVPSNLCQCRGRQRLQDPRVGRGARVLAADIVQGGGAPRPRPPAGGRGSGPNCRAWPCGRGRKGCARGCGVAAVGVRRPHRRRDGSALALRRTPSLLLERRLCPAVADGGRRGAAVPHDLDGCGGMVAVRHAIRRRRADRSGLVTTCAQRRLRCGLAPDPLLAHGGALNHGRALSDR